MTDGPEFFTESESIFGLGKIFTGKNQLLGIQPNHKILTTSKLKVSTSVSTEYFEFTIEIHQSLLAWAKTGLKLVGNSPPKGPS